MSTLKRFNLGLSLALAAWIMQLSVFLTPIFANQIGIGHGVCAELTILADTPVSASAAEQQHVMDMPGMSMADMPGMAAMDHSVAASDHSTSPQQVQHTTNHALCGFCLLFGHSVLPPTIGIEPLSAQAASVAHTAAIASFDTAFILTNKNLRPQGRAPPVFSA